MFWLTKTANTKKQLWNMVLLQNIVWILASQGLMPVSLE